SDVLGARLPVDLPEDPIAQRLAAGVKERLQAGVSGKPESLDLIRFCMDMMETSRQRARLFSGHYLTPSEAEYMALRLPPPLYLLYYPFRPARLFHKRVIKALL